MSYPRKDDVDAPYMPPPAELAERAERVRRSWSAPVLRAKLGLKYGNRLRNWGESDEQDDEDWE